MRHAKKFKDSRPRATRTDGSPVEAEKAVGGFSPPQIQSVVPTYGEGPHGNVASQVPYGEAPPVAPPPVGAGKGFKGWR